MSARGLLAVAAAFALAACGNAPPPWRGAEGTPKPAPPAVAQPQSAPQPAAEKAPPQTLPKPDPNQVLAERVKKALESEARDQADGIDVRATEGTVSLWGTVASDADRTRAARIAAAVEGVRSIENKLAVVKGS